MNLKHKIKILAAALLIATTPIINAAPPAPTAPAKQITQKAFATPDDAAKALAEAVRAEDVNALLAVVGPSSHTWLFSGDAVTDRNDWKKFLADFDQKYSISESADKHAFLLVGNDGWPFPAPLVHKSQGWVFDTEAGREEIINRRVGRNELNTIQTLLAVVDAQREYAAEDLDGNGYNDYAQRFISSTGKKDGLYWPVAAGERPSPLGPLVGEATLKGYGKDKKKNAGGDQSSPYNGYYYRILTKQGKKASGGGFDYLVDDKMIGGFAILAYPAKFGASGIMTFMVNHDGVVFEKDLGETTAAEARKIQSFNPDAGWKKTQMP